MKKVLILGMMILACVAAYLGIVTFKTGDGELAIGFDSNKAEVVADEVKKTTEKALEKVKSD